MLFAFYQLHPTAMDPTLAKQDGVFPLFVVTQMPAGIAGLIIAAVFCRLDVQSGQFDELRFRCGHHRLL